MTHPSIKNVSWVPYNEHDELKRAMAEIELLELVVSVQGETLKEYEAEIDSDKKRIAEIERLTAVVDAAVVYVHALESHGAGVPDRGATKKYLKNLKVLFIVSLEEVAAFEEHDL